jgi:hypothetical protein
VSLRLLSEGGCFGKGCVVVVQGDLMGMEGIEKIGVYSLGWNDAL